MKKVTLFFSVVLLYSYTGIAQTKKFATSAPSVSAGITTTGSTDSNLSTKTRLEASSLNDKFIELRFPDYDPTTPTVVDPIPANTTSYVKIATQDSYLGTLIGGALGDLLQGVLGGLAGHQTFNVQARNNSNIVLNSDNTAYSSYSGDRLRIIRDSSGDFYVMITPNADYNRIRITAKVPVLSDPKWLDVYDAFYIQNTATCALGNYTSYNGYGLVSLADTGVTNPHFAIDAITTNHSSLSLGLLGVASFVEQSVYFEGPSQQNDKYYVKLRLSPALVQAGLLSSIKLIAHKNGSEVTSQSIDGLLTADLLGLLSLNQPVTIPFSPGSADRITVKMSGLLNVSIPQVLELYGITKGTFGLSLTGGGTCIRDASMPLSVQVTGCSGPYTYAWQGVSSTAATANPATDSPGTYTYTVTVTDKYGIQQKATTTITVEEPPVRGAVTGSQPVCSDTTPLNLTLTGHIGNVLWWEKSTNANFNTVTTIPNTTSVLTGAEIGEVNTTTYFRAAVKRNSYAPVFSEAAAVFVKKTTWDGFSWSNGTPDIETTIYITGDYTSDTDLYGCSMHVYNSAAVIITSGKNITLYGALNVHSGTFTLQNNANLIQQTDAVNTGNIVAEKNSSLLYRLDYTIWCSPVTGIQTLQQFSPATMSNRFYIYNTISDTYMPVTPDVAFTTGKGYLIRMPNAYSPVTGYNNGAAPIQWPGKFTGVPNNGTINIPLTHTGTGYNAIGNPYPSAINIYDFINANHESMSDEGAIYFWRKKNNHSNSSYAVITKMGYNCNNAEGGDTGGGLFTGNPSTWVLNPGQGFIVQARANGSALVFNNTMRRSVNNNQFFRTAQTNENELSRLWINLVSDNGHFSQTTIGYTAVATEGIDFGWDGKAIVNDGNTIIYTTAATTPLAIQARPAFTIADVVPVNFRADDAGNYHLALDHFDGVFAEGQDIFVRDNITGTITDLKAGDYTFTTEAGTFEGRFDIIYAQPLSTDNTAMDANSVIVYKNGSTISISSEALRINSIEVYDIRGRILYNAKDLNASETVVEGLLAQEQVLIVKISTEKGQISKKIIF
jgi:hypothetical protein